VKNKGNMESNCKIEYGLYINEENIKFFFIKQIFTDHRNSQEIIIPPDLSVEIAKDILEKLDKNTQNN